MKKFIITQEHENVRLDRWFKKEINELSQALLEKIIRKKKILLNGSKPKSNVRLKSGDIIEVEPYFTNSPENSNTKRVDPYFIQKIQQAIIFENEDFIAINKPNNIAVQGGSKIKISIDDVLPFLSSSHNLKLVHRLDKNTTGVLLIAKNGSSAQILAKAFHEGIIHKRYLAILVNTPRQKQGLIEYFMKKSFVDGIEKMVVSDDESGVKSITRYKVLEELKDNFCLVEFLPLTGRTHQLRLLAETLNCPILGDKKYKISCQNPVETKYLFLHAESININHIFSKRIIIQAKQPEYFLQMLQKLSSLL